MMQPSHESVAKDLNTNFIEQFVYRKELCAVIYLRWNIIVI